MSEKHVFNSGISGKSKNGSKVFVSSNVIDRDTIIVSQKRQAVGMPVAKNAAENPASVTMIEEEGNLSGIVVTCSCGKQHKILFEYDD